MARKPQALRAGDAVAVVAPASPAAAEDTERGVAVLEGLGLRVVRGRHLGARRGYLAGDDGERARDLLDAFADPEVRAVFCLRGGYGSLRILPLLDYGLIAAHPKALVGYSDVTALLLAVHRLGGLVVFHGPMVASDLGRSPGRATLAWLRRALFAPEPLGALPVPEDGPDPVTVRGGVAEGELVGGNLSLVASTLGTPYEIETDGRLLFLEEVGEEPYRLDRLLTHLRNAGKLARVAGVALGHLGAWPGAADASRWVEVRRVVEELLGGLGVPVLAGLPFGHGPWNLTLPLGVRAVLDATGGTLTLVEPATEPPPGRGRAGLSAPRR